MKTGFTNPNLCAICGLVIAAGCGVRVVEKDGAKIKKVHFTCAARLPGVKNIQEGHAE